MKAPRLSDIQPSNHFEGTTEMVDTDLNGARFTHTQEMIKRKKDIERKISQLEKKLEKHFLKEGMLDKIISGTYFELENLGDKEFTRKGQKQTVLIKQLEALSIVHDTILKYEDMIQKYHKIMIDLDNNKLNSFLKVESLKKEEKVTDDNLSELLIALQDQLRASPNAASGTFLNEIEEELKADNY
jgi:hypothetical protein